MRLNPPKRRSRRQPAPVTPGLGQDSVPYLTPTEASARLTAAVNREAESKRRSTAHSLAERVAAVAAPVRPAPAPTPAAPVESREKPAKPWREGPLVVRVPPKRPRQTSIPLRPNALSTDDLRHLLPGDRQRF